MQTSLLRYNYSIITSPWPWLVVAGLAYHVIQSNECETIYFFRASKKKKFLGGQVFTETLKKNNFFAASLGKRKIWGLFELCINSRLHLDFLAFYLGKRYDFFQGFIFRGK